MLCQARLDLRYRSLSVLGCEASQSYVQIRYAWVSTKNCALGTLTYHTDCEFVWMFEIGCISTLNLLEVGLDIVELPLPWDFVEVPKSRFSWSRKVLY